MVERDLPVSIPFQTEPVFQVEELEASYFIKYEPELAESFKEIKKEREVSVSVSGRLLSILYSRLVYWSKYAKHSFNGKRWFWKSQKELGEEIGVSTKQINRALKALEEIGLLVREKFHAKFWRQTYFYWLPFSKHTIEMGIKASAPGGLPAAGGAPGGRGSRRQNRGRKINGGKGFGSNGKKCPSPTQELPHQEKLTLKSIVERCFLYGQNPPRTINREESR